MLRVERLAQTNRKLPKRQSPEVQENYNAKGMPKANVARYDRRRLLIQVGIAVAAAEVALQVSRTFDIAVG